MSDETTTVELWVAPVRPLLISSLFGPRPRYLPDGTPGPLHAGIDCACSRGQAVHVVADGDVVRSYLSANNPPEARPGMPRPPEWPPEQAWPLVMGYGECILVVHLDGTTTRYAHLQERLVEAGEHVSAGQVIGLAGSTGWSTGPHLHFEVRRARGFVNPLPLLMHLHPCII